MKRAVVIVVVIFGMLAPASAVFAQSAEEIRHFIGRLEAGKPLSYRNLTVVPVLLRSDWPEPNLGSYLTLDQALERGLLDIREKDEGDVPWVVVSNRSDRSIFIMGGEILSGCKQDRIVARDVLIAPHRKRLLVPVYCVEAGRWHHVSGAFKSEKNLGTYSMRAAAQGSTGNNQMEVWNRVAESNRKMGVSSDTEAYQDVFRKDEVAELVSDVEEKFKDLPRLGKQTTGVIIALGNHIIGVDIFASPDLFRALWPKIIKSCVVLMSGYEGDASLTGKRAQQFLNALQGLSLGRQPGVDLGIDYSGELKDFAVNALVVGNAVFHLSAVPHDSDIDF
ncbi:MAG: hypothetical protein JSV89_09460 [Spirochaetaceae bacterium]|nr:MAG: hypothetical protein JSV89_09460 [Spirochaetaceae bacterium]